MIKKKILIMMLMIGAILLISGLTSAQEEQQDIIDQQNNNKTLLILGCAIAVGISGISAATGETYIDYRRYREVLDALAGLGSPAPDLVGLDAVPEQGWMKNDPDIESWWNPVEVLEQVRIPVLAIFGDMDSNGDPIQGAYAWRRALQQAGNSNCRVELLPGVNHFMAAAESTCIKDHMKTFDQILKDQGYGSFDEALALILKEPGKHTPCAPGPLHRESWN